MVKWKLAKQVKIRGHIGGEVTQCSKGAILHKRNWNMWKWIGIQKIFSVLWTLGQDRKWKNTNYAFMLFNHFSSLHTLNRPSVWISEGSCEFNFTDKLRWVDGGGSSKIIRIPVPSNYKIKRKSSLVVRQWPSFKSTQSKDIGHGFPYDEISWARILKMMIF